MYFSDVMRCSLGPLWPSTHVATRRRIPGSWKRSSLLHRSQPRRTSVLCMSRRRNGWLPLAVSLHLPQKRLGALLTAPVAPRRTLGAGLLVARLAEVAVVLPASSAAALPHRIVLQDDVRRAAQLGVLLTATSSVIRRSDKLGSVALRGPRKKTLVGRNARARTATICVQSSASPPCSAANCLLTSRQTRPASAAFSSSRITKRVARAVLEQEP